MERYTIFVCAYLQLNFLSRTERNPQMKKLNATERQTQIEELLSQRGVMKIMDLANYFNVSRETIRRDLICLKHEGRIQKWFGGVISAKENQAFNIQPLEEKKKLNFDIKMQICRKALELIPPHSDIYLGDGSTVLCLAALLNQESGHTIITSSIEVATTCANSQNTIVLCGGVLKPLGMSTVGAPAVDFLKNLKTDIAFLGTSGFQLNDGPTGNDFENCNVKKTALENTQTSILLSDSSKSFYSSLITFADWEQIDYLVTDSQIDQEVYNRIMELTNIILAEAQ